MIGRRDWPAHWAALWKVLKDTGALGAHPGLGLVHLLGSVARHGPNPYALVAWHARTRPGQAAIQAWDGVLSYCELQRAADALATDLKPLITPGSRVGLLGRGGARWLVGLLAASRLGAEVVLLNTLHSPAEWAGQVGRLGLCAVLHEAALKRPLRSVPHPAALVNLTETRKAAFFPLPVPPRVGAVTLLTSGSTGTPRAIRRRTGLSRALAVLTATDFLSRLSFRAGERVWLPPPLFHGQGLSALMLCLGFGGTLVLAPEPQGQALRVSLEASSPHWVVVVPTVLHRLLQSDTTFRLPHLRGVLSGSAMLSPALASAASHAFQGRLFNLYGTTETGPISLATPTDMQEAPGTVGRVLRGVEVSLRGEEVHVRSPFLAVPETGWRTGDLGMRDSQGRLHLRGRADDRFICGGENVDPVALEQRIEALPGVRECAVYPVPNAEYGQVIHALIVPGGLDIELHALQTELERALPRTLRPRSIRLCAELPRNAAGKLLRRHLPDWLPQA